MQDYSYLQERPVTIYRADIVFCFDRSGSMSPYIEFVKNNVIDFVNSLKKEDNVDARLGFICQDDDEFFIKKIGDNPEEFAKALSNIKTGGNEFTLPALDWCLDMLIEVERKSHKIVVVLTDEPLRTGHDPEFQRSKINELRDKIEALKFNVLYFGEDCEEYKSFFTSLSKGFYAAVDYNSIANSPMQMLEVLQAMKKTISQTSQGKYMQERPASVQKNIYGLPVGGRPSIKWV